MIAILRPDPIARCLRHPRAIHQMVIVLVSILALFPSIAALAAPANDSFADAAALSGLIGAVNGSNVGAGKESGEPDHDGQQGGASIWYLWSAPADIEVTFTTAGSALPGGVDALDTLLAVYTGNTLGGLEIVESNDDSAGEVTSRVTFQAVAGVTYCIAVDGFDGVSGSIRLEWLARPSNDRFDDGAVLLGVEGAVTGSTVGAGSEPGEPVHGNTAGGQSVWYFWSPLESGQATFNTFGSAFDTALAIYTGSLVNSLTSVAHNDNAEGTNASQVTFTAHAGAIYRIALDGAHGESGSFVLSWEMELASPSNDHFESAQTIFGPAGQFSGNNRRGTRQLNEPLHANSPGGRSVWFQWVAPADGWVVFDTRITGADTVLAAYSGSQLSALSLADENDDIDGGVASEIRFPTTAGEAYFVAIDDKEGGSDFVLQWSYVGATAPNNHFVDALPILNSAGTMTAINMVADKEAGEPDHANNRGGRSIWYRWQSAVGGQLSFSTAGSNFDTLLAVYSSNSADLATLGPVVSNDDAAGDLTSAVSFEAQSGAVYYIAIDGFNGAGGTVVLNWNGPPPDGAPVPLTIERLHDGKVVISWPSGASGGFLESSATFASGATWTPVSPSAALVGDRLVVTNQSWDGLRFYRLRK